MSAQYAVVSIDHAEICTKGNFIKKDVWIEKNGRILPDISEITLQISRIIETRKALEHALLERVSRERVKKVVREKVGEEQWLEGDWSHRWKALERAAELCTK